MRKWAKEHMIASWVICSILFAFIIHVFFSWGARDPWIAAKWTAGELLTYVSTVALGLLAVWQNKRFKEENDVSQERLEALTKQANEISKKLADIELKKSTPYIDIRPILERDLSEYSRARSIVCSVEGCDIYLDDNFKPLYGCGELLFFSVKNVRDNDILDISVSDIQLSILEDGKKTEEKRYSVSVSCFVGALSGKESTALVISIPSDWFPKIAERSLNPANNKNHVNLGLGIVFRLTNNDGNIYQEIIDLELVNAEQRGLMSPIIVNKKLSESIKEE